jgi:hypothetical protein
MTNSHAVRKSAWRFFIALRVGFFAFTILGVVLLFLGNDYGIFVAMLGALLGYASAFRRCTHCGNHVGWVGKWGLGFANPLARNCSSCGERISQL